MLKSRPYTFLLEPGPLSPHLFCGLRPYLGCEEVRALGGHSPSMRPMAVPLWPHPLLCAPSTVLLLNPVEVQAEFLAVANKLSAPVHSPHSAYITLLLHAFQATFGAHCDLAGLHCRLQVCVWGPGPTLSSSRRLCLLHLRAAISRVHCPPHPGHGGGGWRAGPAKRLSVVLGPDQGGWDPPHRDEMQTEAGDWCLVPALGQASCMALHGPLAPGPSLMTTC